MNRLATVKKDGTVQFEVPANIKNPSLHLGPGVSYDHTSEMEEHYSAEYEDLPPMQIVMLIVGTRGDVQPFIAIGKRLHYLLCRGRVILQQQNLKDLI
ncbi:sterol 3-beta-glucosyltransferase UGT80A2-like [Silene latifolia]